MTYGIYSILLLFVIGIWIHETLQFDEALSYMWGWENRYDFASVVYSLKLINPFSASVFSLFLLTGLFIKNRVGWILITGWFYFVCWNFFKTLIVEKIDSISMSLQLVLIIAIPILFIILMNRFNGISEYHQLEKRNKVTLNLWSAGVGLLLATLLYAKKNMLQHWL